MKDFSKYIRNVKDFPKKGIVFRDITTLLKDGNAFSEVINIISDNYANSKIDIVAGIESRGFLFASPIAYKLGVGVVPIRKPGKLPAKTSRVEYDLEYGTDALEIHTDAINKGQNVLLVDDLLATGGTISAAAKLIEDLGGKVVGIAFLIELDFLKGREKLSEYNIFSIIHYDSE